MKIEIPLLCLVVALTVAACSKQSNVESNAGTAEDEARACVAQAGDWRRVCAVQVYQCVKPFPDAGRACSDSSECAGECLVELNTICGDNGECTDPEVPSPGDLVTGVCQRDDDPCGSFVIVREGRAQPVIHRD